MLSPGLNMSCPLSYYLEGDV